MLRCGLLRPPRCSKPAISKISPQMIDSCGANVSYRAMACYALAAVQDTKKGGKKKVTMLVNKLQILHDS